MRIVISLLTFNNQVSGAGYYAKRVLESLDRNKDNHEIFLLVNKKSDFIKLLDLDRNRFKFIYLNSPIKRNLRVLFEQFILPLKLKKIQFDIFFSPNPVLPVFASKKNKKKYICTIHDLTPLIIKKDNYFQKIYYKFLTNISAKKADKIIAVSQNTKDDLNRLMGVPKSKIHVIYNFLEDNYSEFVEKRISIDRPYFLYVGNMHVGKNIINLIKAFALFKKRHNNNHVLLFIGKKGFGYNKIIDEIALRKLQNDVKILGYLEDNLIKSYYKKAHALVFPSYYEGFGYPPLEAIALQTVPIVSNIPPITEVVGECGFYFNPSDIEDIYKCFVNSLDNDLLNSKKEKIHRQLEKFNSEKSINQMLSLFKETII